MRDIQFAIPSYKRSDQIREKTIQTLEELQVPKSRVSVFVADEEERVRYASQLPDYNLVVGELGIGNQRTFINSYYDVPYVSLDDDVTLVQKDGNRVKPFTGNLYELAERAFNLCDEVGAKMWGVPETDNGFFMKHQTVHGLRACTGCLMGEYGGLPEVQSRRDHTEDLEKCLLHYIKYGGFLRLDDLTTKQKRYSSGGVLEHLGGKESRLEVYRKSVLDMVKLYPEILQYKEKEDPTKGMTKVKVKTSGRYPSLLPS